MPPETYLTTAQVAELYGLTPAAISYRVRRGQITPAMKAPGVRGAYLFRLSDIEQLLELEAQKAS